MKRRWDPYDLAEHWTLSPPELDLLGNKSGATRLGFALLLKFFQHEARFPHTKHEIPGAVVVNVAAQVGVPAELYPQYDWSGRAIKYHRVQIRDLLGFREATVQDSRDLAAWLRDEVLPHDHRHERARAAVYDRCRAARIEPPTADRVDRLVRSALHAFEGQLAAVIAGRLSPETLHRMDALLRTDTPEVGDDPDAADPEVVSGAAATGASLFHSIKADAGPIGLDSVLAEIAKLERIRRVQLPLDLFAGVSPKILALYRRRAAAEPPSELRAHAAPVRALLVAALCALRRQEITDSLVDLLIGVVQKIGARAERTAAKELLADVKKVAGKTTILYRMAEASLEHPLERVCDAIWPVAGGEGTLRDLLREARADGPTYRLSVQTRLQASYKARYRRLLPHILDALEFRSNNAAHRPVIDALALLKRYVGSKKRYYARAERVPLDGVVPPGWLGLVVSEDKKGRARVDRIAYEICVLQAVRDKVRCKGLWVVGGRRFGNPDDDLPADFEAQRETYFAELQLPTDADAFIAGLQRDMATGLAALDRGLPKNKGVEIREWLSGASGKSAVYCSYGKVDNLARTHGGTTVTDTDRRRAGGDHAAGPRALCSGAVSRAGTDGLAGQPGAAGGGDRGGTAGASRDGAPLAQAVQCVRSGRLARCAAGGAPGHVYAGAGGGGHRHGLDQPATARVGVRLLDPGSPGSVPQRGADPAHQAQPHR